MSTSDLVLIVAVVVWLVVAAAVAFWRRRPREHVVAENWRPASNEQAEDRMRPRSGAGGVQ